MPWDEEAVLEMIVNPVYTGIGPFPSIIKDELWIKAVEKEISENGTGKVLTTMLKVLREDFPK